MAQSVTLSSAGTATMILNPVAKSTTVLLTATSGSSGGFITVELTLDDPTTTPSPTIAWGSLSSAAAITSSNVTSLLWTVLSPIGGVRLNSSGVGNASFTLKALQSVTA